LFIITDKPLFFDDLFLQINLWLFVRDSQLILPFESFFLLTPCMWAQVMHNLTSGSIIIIRLP